MRVGEYKSRFGKSRATKEEKEKSWVGKTPRYKASRRCPGRPAKTWDNLLAPTEKKRITVESLTNLHYLQEQYKQQFEESRSGHA